MNGRGGPNLDDLNQGLCRVFKHSMVFKHSGVWGQVAFARRGNVYVCGGICVVLFCAYVCVCFFFLGCAFCGVHRVAREHIFLFAGVRPREPSPPPPRVWMGGGLPRTETVGDIYV